MQTSKEQEWGRAKKKKKSLIFLVGADAAELGVHCADVCSTWVAPAFLQVARSSHWCFLELCFENPGVLLGRWEMWCLIGGFLCWSLLSSVIRGSQAPPKAPLGSALPGAPTCPRAVSSFGSIIFRTLSFFFCSGFPK